jgi:hypothetical protein
VSSHDEPKKKRSKTSRRIRSAGLTSMIAGAGLLAAGGAAVGLTSAWRKSVTRTVRKNVPEPRDALQIASGYLPLVLDHLADGNGNGAGKAAKRKNGKKDKKGEKAKAKH